MTDIKVAAQVRQHIAGEHGPLQALALALAKRIDAGEAGMASNARELRATLRELDLEHVGSVDDRVQAAVAAALAEERARHDGAGTPDAEEEGPPVVDAVADITAERARRIADAEARH